MSTLQEIQAAAGLLLPEQKQELLVFLTSQLRDERAAGLDAVYERGYEQSPEDLSLTSALLPHLAVDVENWE